MVGTNQARELGGGARVIKGGRGGFTHSLQTGVMKYQLSERLVLPSGWLARAQFKFTLWTES